MDKVGLISFNSNIQSITENKLLFINGQTIQAEVLNNTDTGVLLKVSNTIIHAQTDLHFPNNTQLLLSVIGQDDQQIILSLNKDVNPYNLDISTIIKNLGLGDSPELRLIVNKLIESKQRLSKENIDTLKLLINKLPLEKGDSLNLLTDPSVHLAIFNIQDKDAGFSLLLNEKEDNLKKEPHLEVNILYGSKTLGHILINVIWLEKINIEMKCSINSTFHLVETNLEKLKMKINTLTQYNVDIKITHDNNLTQDIHWVKQQEKALFGIDIRI